MNRDYSKAGIGQIQLPTLVINRVLLEQRHSVVYLLSMAAFMLREQS